MRASVAIVTVSDKNAELFDAARRGDTRAVKRLLDAGANANGTKRARPIHAAVVHGHRAVIAALLSRGADAEYVDSFSGFTPLMEAAWSGRLALVQLLFPDDRQDASRTAALVLAAKEGRTSVVRFLLRRGVDPEGNRLDGKTALEWARKKRRTAIVKLLAK